MMTIDAFRHRSLVAPFVPGKRYNVLPLVLLTKRHLFFSIAMAILPFKSNKSLTAWFVKLQANDCNREGISACRTSAAGRSATVAADRPPLPFPKPRSVRPPPEHHPPLCQDSVRYSPIWYDRGAVGQPSDSLSVGKSAWPSSDVAYGCHSWLGPIPAEEPRNPRSARTG